jgi:hypothetical protein
MDNKNNPEQQENRNEQSSEFYNRAGSTEHNDYHISGKNENLSADSNEKESSNEKDKNSETRNAGQQATDDLQYSVNKKFTLFFSLFPNFALILPSGLLL